eukprot:3938377-Rhodomonas_salina.3
MVVQGICLCACYTVSGTGIAYAENSLRDRYAVSGMDVATSHWQSTYDSNGMARVKAHSSNGMDRMGSPAPVICQYRTPRSRLIAPHASSVPGIAEVSTGHHLAAYSRSVPDIA